MLFASITRRSACHLNLTAIFTILLLGFSGPEPGVASDADRGAGSQILVGDDPECDFATVHDAVDEAEDGDTIIVIGDGFFSLEEELELTRSITLKGGYEDCFLGDYSDDPPILFAEGNHRGIKVHSPEGRNLHVEFQDIGLGGGFTETVSASGRFVDADGAGLLVHGGHTITATNFSVGLSNAAGNGGAIALIETVDGAPEMTISGTSRIFMSSAAGHGGGIFCSGGSIHIDNDTGVHLNSAGLNGGGIYLDDCQLEFGSGGRDLPGQSHPSGIVDNQADELGGGLFATGQSQVQLDGAEPNISELPHLPVEIVDNSALDGGAIYLEGANTEAELVNVIIAGNQAESGSAAIAVVDQASLAMHTDEVCHNRAASMSCSKVSSNTTTGAVPASIVAVTSNAHARFHQTEVFGNELDHGHVFHIHDSDFGHDEEIHSLTLYNSLVANNHFRSDSDSGSSVFGVVDSSSVSIEWSTVSTQTSAIALSAVIDTQVDEIGQTALFIEGLLVDQDDTTSLVSTGAGETQVTRAACIVARDITSIEDHSSQAELVTGLIEEDPGLVNPQIGNHRLASHSPALNGCEIDLDPDPPLLGPQNDIDNQMRKGWIGVDYQDIGAFDRDAEILLHDRFED